MTAAGLVVVGGGPIGLACAIEARLAGMDVLVIEPRDDPIDKACGEGLMPGALAALHRIGVDPPGHPLAGIAYLDGANRVEHRFAERPGRGVRRTVLHRELARRAAELNTRVVRGRVAGLEQRRDGVQLRLADGELVEAPWVIGADGLHSPVRRLLGLDGRAQHPVRRRYGLRRHYAVAPWTDLVEVHWSPLVEAYVTPVDDRTVGVAVLGPRPLDQAAAIEAIPALGERLAGAEAVTEARGAGPSCSVPGRGRPDGSCSPATPPATWTRSPARECAWGSRRRVPPSPLCGRGTRSSTSGPGGPRPATSGC